jgi:hypothetical protein
LFALSFQAHFPEAGAGDDELLREERAIVLRRLGQHEQAIESHLLPPAASPRPPARPPARTVSPGAMARRSHASAYCEYSDWRQPPAAMRTTRATTRWSVPALPMPTACGSARCIHSLLHSQALAIYVHKLNDHKGAEAYCERVHNEVRLAHNA